MRERAARRWICLLGCAWLLLACSGGGNQYRATIHRTSYGIPHVVASDWRSLGFGEGYAQAEDHLCSLVDEAIRVRGHRARTFGPGANGENVLSDLAIQALEIREHAAEDLASSPPELREQIEGFAAGVNAYLRRTGAANVPGWCRGASWVGEIEPLDVVSRMRSLALVSSLFSAPIVGAAPPGEKTARLEMNVPEIADGSNGWAIGSERSAGGGGMLLANPHYPWVGARRFWEKQLTIPGVLDVYGVSLVGLPGVAIGFNEHVAWTHTVSSGARFTLYRVRLVDGKPTSYMYDGQERAMESREISAQVLQKDGSMKEVRRTVYRTLQGRVLSMPPFEWTKEYAYAIRDANEDNGQVLSQWLDMARAKDMDDFQKAHERHAAMPWVNTVAVSSDGRAWYADTSSTPDLSPEAFAAWKQLRHDDKTFEEAYANGVILLDGSNSLFEWADEPGARAPGLVPYQRLPKQERRDYLFNANQSFWIANSSAPNDGYTGLHGLIEKEPLSPRARMNDLVLSDRTPAGPAGADGRFTLEELTRAAFLDRELTAELLAPQLAERCRKHPAAEVKGRKVDLEPACEALAAYNGRLDLDSPGAVLWREFITRFEESDLLDAGPLFAEPFDPADPVHTPRGLAEGEGVLRKLAEAVLVLERAGLKPDATLAGLQYTDRNGKRIPIHGGEGEWEGVTNVVSYVPNDTTMEPDPEVKPLVEGSRLLREDGYPVNRGTSFIMALEFTGSGPRAMALLTYGESGDPASPHFTDQTELFSRKEWRPVLFEQKAILGDPELRSYDVSQAVTGP